VRPFLTSAALKDKEPAIEALVKEVVDDLEPGVDLDLVERFSIPISVNTMCEFVGLSPDHRDLVLAGADAEVALHGAFTSEEESLQHARAWVEFQHLLANEIEDRQSNPSSDLTSGIANPPARDDGYKLTQYEMVSLAKLAVIAGNETTRGLLSHCLLNLAKYPALLDRIRNDRVALEGFIEETLRLAPPVMSAYRVATCDTEIAGVEVKEGEIVIVSYGGANYDPAKFACPYEHDIDRENVRRHLGFGFGLHYCMGFSLARLETRIALERFIERFDAPELIPDEAPSRYGSILVYSLQHLPARLQLRAK
jgi:cytochrome P450